MRVATNKKRNGSLFPQKNSIFASSKAKLINHIIQNHKSDMRRNIFIVVSLLVFIGLSAQNISKDYLAYIEQYKSLAIKEQYRHGIPASITMAQALIESNAGRSMLAVKGNNHFGIKCGSNWSGKTINKDDDNIQECFRWYNKPIESYEDHSLFLKRDRYASLYDIPLKDYKTWARELRRLGYATDVNYADKLIKIIEDYGLEELVYENFSSTTDNTDRRSKTTVEAETKTKDPIGKRHSSGVVDYSDLLSKTRNNGRTCYILKKDATMAQIAASLNKTNIKFMLYCNDMYEDFTLKAGTYIYISKKRSSGDSSIRSYNVRIGDSMHSVAQRYGITLKALYSINNLPYGTPATDGMTLFFHK